LTVKLHYFDIPPQRRFRYYRPNPHDKANNLSCQFWGLVGSETTLFCQWEQKIYKYDRDCNTQVSQIPQFKMQFKAIATSVLLLFLVQTMAQACTSLSETFIWLCVKAKN
jgi:hypothetical protein